MTATPREVPSGADGQLWPYGLGTASITTLYPGATPAVSSAAGTEACHDALTFLHHLAPA